MTQQPHHTKQHHKEPQENGLAIASFILGIVSLTGLGAVTGIPALITGFLSLKNPVNKGFGIAGLVMGLIATIFSVILALAIITLIIVGIATDPSIFDETSTPADDSSSSHTRSI